MRIVVSAAYFDGPQWLRYVQETFPNAQVELWLPGCQEADYALVWQPTQQFFDEQKQLKLVINLGAGVDWFLKLKLPENVPLIRMEDVGMAQQMKEYVLYGVLRFFRQFEVYETHQKQTGWVREAQPKLSNCSVGVMGLGILGAQVASTLAQFDFPVLGWCRTAKEQVGVRCFHGEDQLGTFLSQSKVLVCMLPLTEQTRGILNHQHLNQLPMGAFLINVGRGGHLVESDLITLLEEGRLAGALLDVFQEEPLPPSHPFWTHPKINITPHISAYTTPSLSMAFIKEKIEKMEQGVAPKNVVNLICGY